MSEELSELYKSLLQVLDEAMQIDGATRGNIHLANPVDGGLQMIVHRGFNPAFVQTFAHMRTDEPTSCARAIRYRHRVIIPDIARDLLFGPYLTICHENGFQAVQIDSHYWRGRLNQRRFFDSLSQDPSSICQSIHGTGRLRFQNGAAHRRARTGIGSGDQGSTQRSR